VFSLLMASPAAGLAAAADWPQWRGPQRDARAAGFQVPATWPAELTQKWKVAVGQGVASPSLVGDKLYVFARQDDNEIIRCLNAATGDQLWQDQYEAEAIRGPASGFDGPRSSPTIAAGKLVLLGAQGMLSCYNADTGELLWRNDDNVGNIPRFATSSSPIVLAGLVITEFGGERAGGLVAYDLNSGEEKWKYEGSGAAYGSPTPMTLGDAETVVAPMADKMIVVAAADGKVLFEMPYTQGRYNSASPIVVGDLLIVAGPTSGMTALKLTRQGDQFEAEEAWKNPDNSVGFNTPVAAADGKLYGISGLNSLFAINLEGGATAWNAPLGGDAAAQGGQGGQGGQAAQGDGGGRRGEGQQGDGGGRRGGGRRGRRGGGGGGGYGSVIDAGSALLALTPTGTLTVFAPGDQFKQLAAYKVAEAGTYAYPVPSQHGLYVKDQDSITLWATGP
jgi:outer membrane protein assembly factor BamB